MITSLKQNSGADHGECISLPSVRERLWRQYHQALENDGPINPTLETLLFGYGEEADPYYDLPLLRPVVKNNNAGGRAAAPGVCLAPVDSMGGTKHETISFPGVCMGGYDGGFESGFSGDWQNRKFERLISELESARKPGESSIITVAGRDFVLQPYGGGNAVHYRYILIGAGWKVYIHHNPAGGVQPIRVRLGFEALCGRSLFDVHAEFMDWLDELGFNVSKEIISRVDLQILVARPFEDFAIDIACRHVVKRSVDSCLHQSGSSYTSYAAGSDIRANFYDKKRQLLDEQDEVGLRMIAEYCCNGVIPDDLTRIEFQVKRSALRVLKINDISDLKASEASLVDYLTFDWFRIIDGPKKKGHTREQGLSSAWQEVRDLFKRYFPGGDNPREIGRHSDKVKDLKCTADMLVAQAVGCMASVAARCKGAFRDSKSVLRYVFERLEEGVDDLFDKVNRRAEHLATIIGLNKWGLEGETDDRSALSPGLAESMRGKFLGRMPE